MGKYQRSIKYALNMISGEVLDADDVFDKTKEAFEIRRQFHEKKIQLSCCECYQDLRVSASKWNNLHFKHQLQHSYCILSDESLSQEDLDNVNNILQSKESDRHKHLKNKIGQLLSKVEGVEINSVSIDNKCIIRNGERRRPDVYCKYHDKEIVFEIQLSDLSLGYILSRHDFYKKHGIYLVWILDKFDIRNQQTLKLDIKYLTKYENFFKLDEKVDLFRLECEYKIPFLTHENKLMTQWQKKSVGLDQVTFDKESCQIYYYNFGDNRNKVAADQSRIANELIVAENKRAEEIKLFAAREKAKEIVSEIRNHRRIGSLNYKHLSEKINNLDSYHVKILNEVLDFGNKEKAKTPHIIRWVNESSFENISFINFILSSKNIHFDVNDRDENDQTAFQAVYQKSDIPKNQIIIGLFKKGYRLQPQDIDFFNTLPIDAERKHDILFYSICNRLTKRSLVDYLDENRKLLFILESIKEGRIVGFKWKENEWVAFANNAIEYHKEHWRYIELALNYYRIWDILISQDKKGTFQGKLKTHYTQSRIGKNDFEEIFDDLYCGVQIEQIV